MNNDNSMSGWVKLYRSVLQNPIITKSLTNFSVWMVLLLKATAKPKKARFCGNEIELQPGQLITSRRKIAEAVKELTVSRVHRALSEFEAEKMIVQNTTAKSTLITIIGWEFYQKSGKIESEIPKHWWNTESKKMEHCLQNCVENKNESKNGLSIEKTDDSGGDVETLNETLIEKPLEHWTQKSETLAYYNRQEKKNKRSRERDARARASTPTHKREFFGKFKNVLLSDEEIGELKTKYPKTYLQKIERLSRYLESTGKTYRNHFSTLLSWLEEDGEQQSEVTKTGQSDRPTTYDLDELDTFNTLDGEEF